MNKFVTINCGAEVVLIRASQITAFGTIVHPETKPIDSVKKKITAALKGR